MASGAAAVARLRPLVLEGSRVRLEPLTAGHAPALARAAAGSRATYGFTLVPEGVASAARYIAEALADQALPFATVDRGSGTVVGSTRYFNLERWTWPPGSPYDRGEDRPDAVEIGWTWLAEPAQRTPVNTEAKLLMLAHAFEVWRVRRVSFNTDARNARSRAAIERLGARLDGLLRAARVAADGGIRDTAAYSIVEAEWPEVRARLTRFLASR